MNKTLPLNETMHNLLNCWLKVDPKRNSTRHMFKEVHAHEKFIGFPGKPLQNFWKTGSDIQHTIYELSSSERVTCDMHSFFQNVPDTKKKEDIFWMINLRYSSSSLIAALTLLMQFLSQKGYTGFEHDGKTYEFSTFIVCDIWYKPKELYSVYFNGFKTSQLKHQVEPILSWCRQEYAMTHVMVCGDMVLDPSFGVHGYSLTNSPFAFLDVTEYFQKLPGSLVHMDESKNYDKIIKKDLSLNGRLCINQCLELMKKILKGGSDGNSVKRVSKTINGCK